MKFHVCALLLLILSSVVGQSNSAMKIQEKETILAYYTEHDPILIDSDSDFLELNIRGVGTQENPYIIEKLYIVSSEHQSRAISVRNTVSHFIIRNCYIVTNYAGIELMYNAARTPQIKNNTVVSSTGFGAGIVVWGTQNSTVIENWCYNLSQGIHLNEAEKCYIANNNITDNNYQGINIRYSNQNIIIDNLIKKNAQHGVALVGTSRYNLIHHNQFIDNGIEDSYRIDGEPRGQLTSQGFDEGSNNTWYDSKTEVGNYWSDYSGSGSYLIDGPSESTDPYPNRDETPTEPVTLDLIQIMIIVSGAGIILVLVIVLVIRKRR